MRFAKDYNDLFPPRLIEKIKETAFNIIERVGVRMTDGSVRDRLAGDGIKAVNGRVTIPAALAEAYLNSMIVSSAGRRRHRYAEDEDRVDGWINTYCHSYLDPVSGKIFPYDRESLTKMTYFSDGVAKRNNFNPDVPGYPSDIPAPCQSIARFVVGNEYLERGSGPDPMCRYSAKYLFEMCGIVDKKISGLPVYLSTPLTIGDESFYVVLENANRLEYASIYSMPSFGANTPLSISGAYSLVLAEQLAGAFIVNRLTGLKTYIGVGLLPFDFKDLNQVFGTPEKVMLGFVNQAFNNALFGGDGFGGGAEIHTHSIHPDAQSAAEKAFSIAAGYMKSDPYGDIRLAGMGTLGMDEVFSPAQLLIDAEIMNYVRRLDRGYDIDEIPDDFLDEIIDGIDAGFIPSERTVARHREYIYHSDLFTRANFSKQISSWALPAEKRAAERAAAELTRKPERFLETKKAEALDKLLEEAIRNA